MSLVLWLIAMSVTLVQSSTVQSNSTVDEDVLFGAGSTLEWVPVGPFSPRPIGFIVNGREATVNSHPYQISLQADFGKRSPEWVHICGGVIVSANKVVTAAHCLPYWGKTKHRVGCGWHTLSSGGSNRGAQTVEVVGADIHGEFQRAKGVPINDIAVLTLKYSVVENESVKFADLPQPDDNFVGKLCRVAGWGRTSGGSDKSDTLQTIEVPVIKRKLCKAYWSVNRDVEITSGNLCTHASNYGMSVLRNLCNGDSGGPLVCNNNTVVGLVSWGLSRCVGCWPDVLTKLSAYQEWLSERL